MKEATSGLKLKDAEIADFALRIYIGDQLGSIFDTRNLMVVGRCGEQISPSIEQGKDKRTEQMPVKNNFEPATIKQKEYLHGLGIDFPKDISKFKAHKLIEENKGKI